MAERIKYETQNDEEKQVPELQELAATPTQTTPAAPVYDSSARDRQSALYEQIASRGPFQYDMANDPLYKTARDRYVQNGRMAMKDTMGQAAALTGGYGSSYGQAVGQQAYDRQLQGLADMIPQLYETAYAKYQDEGDRLQNLYAMAGAQADQDYNRYRDELGDWQYERAWQQQMDETNYARQNESYTRLYSLISSTGYQPSPEQLAAAGMSQEEADAIRNEYLRQTGQLPSTGGGSGGGYYSGSGSSSDGGLSGLGASVQQAVQALINAGASEEDVRAFVQSESGSRAASKLFGESPMLNIQSVWKPERTNKNGFKSKLNPVQKARATK